MNLNAYATADQTLARLIKEASINVAAHMIRLDIISQSGTRKIENITGVERDLLVSVLYSLNESLAILNSTSSHMIRDAVFLGNTKIVDWYKNAIGSLHAVNVESETLAPINKAFEERMSWLDASKPPRPANADELDKAFAGDDAAVEGTVAVEGFEDDPEAFEEGVTVAANDEPTHPGLAEAAGLQSQASE